MAKWGKTENGFSWSIYLGDTLVIYLVAPDPFAGPGGQWIARRKVPGAANSEGIVVGSHRDPETAMRLAEADAEQAQEVGL